MKKESGTRFAKAAALVGAGALGASILTGVAFAADPTPAPGASSSAESERGGAGHRGPERPGGKHGGLLGGFGGDVLHGEATVENEDGTTQRVRAVRGEVIEVSESSITVRASDGFTQTYAITADTKIHLGRDGDGSTADISVGDRAMVAGSISGDSATAMMIGAMSPAEAAEMEERMAERRAEMEQRMAEREQSESPSPQS